ncbi:MAG: HAD-IC family P-type ATPase, partial [Planctomycetes bacterium]|nr:HAD-IC family P-type ATPase [Planctomycetota bacterium]
HRGERGKFACIKGAPEVVLAASASLWSPKGDRELTEADRETILEASQGMAEAALRVLALADRDGASREDVHAGLRFLGLVGMIDPPRDAARDAVATCRKAGIRVIMITGDHPRTASAVARELGFASHDRVLTGAELDRMDEARWGQELRDVDVFARVSPEHKLRIVTELQAQGEVVAMTGDGVNDAPALKKADIGVAMGITGTDVAKEAADMTLTNDDFASIVAAVAEGRAIFGNVKKYLMFLLSSNVGEIGLMAGAVLAGLPLPLTAVQILYVNLATDGLPALALAVDPPPDDLMAQKPRKQKGGVFSRPVVTLMLMGGLWSIIVNLGLFIWARQTGHGLESAMTMTFVSLVLIQFFKAFGFRSLTHHVFCGLFSNRWLNLAIVWEVALLVAIVVLPVLHEPFGTRALTASEWTEVILVAATVLPVLELGKWMIRRGWFGAESGL